MDAQWLDDVLDAGLSGLVVELSVRTRQSGDAARHADMLLSAWLSEGLPSFMAFRGVEPVDLTGADLASAISRVTRACVSSAGRPDLADVESVLRSTLGTLLRWEVWPSALPYLVEAFKTARSTWQGADEWLMRTRAGLLAEAERGTE